MLDAKDLFEALGNATRRDFHLTLNRKVTMIVMMTAMAVAGKGDVQLNAGISFFPM
jgi:hypothetical protein